MSNIEMTYVFPGYNRCPLGGFLFLHDTQERLKNGFENVTRASIDTVTIGKWVNYPFNLCKTLQN